MFDGKTWWITGASSGLGASLAEALGRAGARLVLSGRNEAALQDTASRCGPNTLLLPFEATDYARIPELVEKAWSWAGRIDGLVNNAGISQRSMAVDTKFEVYERIIGVDLLGPIALTQALLPRMVAAGGGDLVAISSVAGTAGVPLRSGYCAAKHGLIGYHDSVRAETAHLGMRVLVVAPGSVRTNVSRNALDANAKTRGYSDEIIDAGMAPEIAVKQIVDAIVAGEREIVVAEGPEAQITALRRTDPNACFDRMAALVASGYAKQLGVTK